MNNAAEILGFTDDEYHKIASGDLFTMYLENVINPAMTELSALSGDEYTKKAQAIAVNMLELWSELDDYTLRMKEYNGIFRALCEGSDMFNMNDDAVDMTGDGSWPKGYFFDDYLAETDKIDSFYVCEEYLRGYGMEDATLCSFGKDGFTYEEAASYIASLKDKGFYTYNEIDEDGTLLWSGCWVGEDGANCYITVEYAPKGEGSIMQQLGGDREFVIMAGNFNFELCINIATLYYFL